MNATRIATLGNRWIRRGVLPLLLLLGASLASAQDDSQVKPVAPDGPLLAAAPAFSQWKVTFTYPVDLAPKSDEAPAAAAGPPPPETRTVAVITTKTKTIVHEETISGQGLKREDWHLGRVQYAMLPGSNNWYQGSDRSNFPLNGFRDLDWITEGNYIGKANFAGKPCLIFVPGGAGHNAAGLLGSLDKLPAVAYIDSESRLPVQVRENGITRAYEFLTPPTEMLSLPPDLDQALKKAEEVRLRLAQPPPRPY